MAALSSALALGLIYIWLGGICIGPWTCNIYGLAASYFAPTLGLVFGTAALCWPLTSYYLANSISFASAICASRLHQAWIWILSSFTILCMASLLVHTFWQLRHFAQLSSCWIFFYWNDSRSNVFIFGLALYLARMHMRQPLILYILGLVLFCRGSIFASALGLALGLQQLSFSHCPLA